MQWKSIFDNTLTFHTQLNLLPTKGKLVYEYNPFRNYRLSENKYLYNNKYYTQKELEEQKIVMVNNNEWLGVPEGTSEPILYEKGLLVDFITDELNFSLEHPVHIIPQRSYDGSVNLIINDGLNIPRMINSRFSATGMNSYEIIDRKGNNDTNIYDSGILFNIDTSLYKIVDNIPKVELLDVSYGGNLLIGNYHFYFKLADSDGNETDFIAESGLVSVFLGDSSYNSVHTGVSNLNSTKLVEFKLTNIDSAYDYIIVYYSRSTALGGENMVNEYYRIDKKYNKSNKRLIITGFEEVLPVSITDINTHYNLVSASKTSAVCQNMLFLGNVKRLEIPYEELLDLSLRILPYRGTKEYNVEFNPNYRIDNTEESYIDPKFIYNNTGYWPGELYRFGIVYILPNGELTPVFDVRGGLELTNNTSFSEFNNKSVEYNETNNLIINGSSSNPPKLENAKGVCSFLEDLEVNTIYYVDFKIPNEVRGKLEKYVKGYFFVRLTRIPLVMAQGVTIGIDKEARIPTIPTKGGLIELIADGLGQTYVETKDIDGVNYISEGFLRRYSFTFKRKGSNLWGKIGKIAAVAGLLVGSAALTIVSMGTAAPGVVAGWASAAGIGAGLTTTTAAGALTLTTAGMVATGVAAGAAAGVVGAAATSLIATGLVIANNAEEDTGRALKGRQTLPGKGEKMVETEDSRLLTLEYSERIIIKDKRYNDIHGIICPDYTVNPAYYNQIFTGNKCLVRTTPILNTEEYFTNDERHYYISSYSKKDVKQTNCDIIAVPDNTKAIGLNEKVYRSRAGEAEEVFRYESIALEYIGEDKKINTDIVRGIFGPYLAFDNNVIGPAERVNIYIPGYADSNMLEYVNIRMSDNSSYFAITERYGINENAVSNYNIEDDVNDTEKPIKAFRGDCYLCQYSQRIFRNFNDPSAPYNDEIVDVGTWKNNYDPSNVESYANINLGDINAILMGMWITFNLRSSYNLNIRTVDESYVDEATMSGHPRSYFPNTPMSVEGTYKLPESLIYNKGFSKSVSDKWNIGVPDSPHIKNWFGTRIMYSDIHINDAYKNGFRIFQGTHYRDYTREYGEIVKLISLESNLLCIFEHGIALIPVNERAVAGQGAGGNVYINTSNVLPENPKIISDTFGSQWAESIIKVPKVSVTQTGVANGNLSNNYSHYIYGVDTVAKKIWRTDGYSIECISDFKVQEFLNNNITLGERELTPKIGIRNVKTHYNAFKRDVMFTFYDNTYGFEEKVWNLCWNELLQLFVTFYSWVPSYMENINNIPFSFNRDTSKWLAKLGVSHTENSFADGITLSNVIMSKDSEEIGTLSLKNRVLPELNAEMDYEIIYHLERDNYGNYKYFEIRGNKLYYKGDITQYYSELYFRNSEGHSYADIEDNKTNIIKYENDVPVGFKESANLNLPIFKDSRGKRVNLSRKEALNPDKIVRLLNIRAEIKIKTKGNNTPKDIDFYNIKAGYEYGTTLINAGYYESTVAVIPDRNIQFLSTDFWKHGLAGIIDIADTILPTYWYGKQHPFEFEVLVVNDPSVHKIFDNLELVANRAKPESFHYEIIGDSYDFVNDKPNMYFRLEARKHIWQYNGADICYDRDYLKTKTKWLIKSADLIHQYHDRQDSINEVEDYYHNIGLTEIKGKTYDFSHLSGGELVYYPNRNEYRIWNHTKAVSLNDLSLDDPRSIIAANCNYLEDKWRITINPIIICYKNEKDWGINPDIPILNSPIPNTILEQGSFDCPKELDNNNITFDNWLVDKYGYGRDSNRKELEVKDRFIKIRIRYSGEELAIIDFLNTIYRVSYA